MIFIPFGRGRFYPVDWSTRRSCKSSKSPPLFVVVFSFVLVIDDALWQNFYFNILTI